MLLKERDLQEQTQILSNNLRGDPLHQAKNIQDSNLYKVLIERFNGEYYIGRSYEMAPEIDGNVYIKEKGLEKDNFYNVKIEKALEYDLMGVVCDESCE